MLSRVIQEEPTGCGIAAVACILGKTYPQMRATANAMGIHAADKSLWSDTNYVRRMLAGSGATTSEQQLSFTSWDALPDLALLPIKHHEQEGKAYWHWVAFTRANDQPQVLDSASYLVSNIRTDFADMHPQWFITVSLQSGDKAGN